MAGEAELTISAPGQTSVTIWTTKIDDNYDKSMSIIQKFRGKADQDSEVEPDTILINIGKVNHIITVQGFLIDETSESAQVKKNNLLKKELPFPNGELMNLICGLGSQSRN